MQKYKVTVIINSCNAEKDIKDLIKSLKRQSRKANEIIVVDDASTDNTVKLAKKLKLKVIEIKKRVKRGKARDIGWRKAKGNIIIYIDQDMIVNKNWIKEILKKFSLGADAVIDRIKVYKPNTWYTASLNDFYNFRMINYKPFSAWAFRKNVLKKVNGFKDLWLEDGELGIRLLKKGFKILLAKKAIRYHKGPPRTFKETIKRNFFFGRLEYHDIYKNFPEKFPKKRIILYLLFLFSIPISTLLGIFYNSLYFTYLVLCIPIIFIVLLLKLAFYQKAIKFISIKNIIGITIASLIRALIWPFGILCSIIEHKEKTKKIKYYRKK